MLRPAPSIFAAALLALALALISVPSCLAAKGAKSPATIDWPHFRFDKLQTGYQPFETALTKQTIKTASLLWQADLPGELVFLSSPAVVNGIVYIGEVDGTLYAY